MRNSAHRAFPPIADQEKVGKKESDYQSSLLFQVSAPILYLFPHSFKKSCRENTDFSCDLHFSAEPASPSAGNEAPQKVRE